MQPTDFEDEATADIRAKLDEALAAASQTPTPANPVNINSGMAVNVGNTIIIGSQTIHQAPTPEKGRP